MRRRSESPSKNERREPVCSERDIRVPERSEGGFPCRSEEHTGSWLIRVEKGPVLSVATSGCPKRSEDGCPCRSEDDPALSSPTILKSTKGTGAIRSGIRAAQQKRVSIIRSDIRVSERSEDGCPCRSEDNTDP